MYDIRQFKPLLYVLLVLGMTGFALAALSPGLWVLGVGGVLLNGWLVATGRFMPLPRWLANLITLGAFGFMAAQLRYSGTSPIMVIGQFLVLLQLVKLFEQRGNRDFAQLLVLSLLLMVAASINTASLTFAILLITYLFLSLYCCLLFHLKAEADQARMALSIPEEKLNPATLRQDERYLTRSMRRLTGIVAVVSLMMAIVVFVAFPRGAGAGLLGPLQARQSEPLTGFGEQVSFQQVAKITQSQEVVATVELFAGHQRVQGTMPLLLRGMTLDVYENEQWSRSAAPVMDELLVKLRREESMVLSPQDDEAELWTQRVVLRPTRTHAVFAMPGAVSFKPGQEIELRYSRRDELLRSSEPLVREIKYEVVSRNQLGRAVPQRERAPGPRSRIDPRIAEYARLPEVAGELVAQRGEERGPHELDEQIATRIEQHLRSAFAYTLDLTDARQILRGDDPIVAFLYQLKRGHCEYFAGSMALMCQSLGMQARVVVGFKSDEYNAFGGYYYVRQAHAHAWVEVLTTEGWKTFDPTSGREAPAGAVAGSWQQIRHLFGYFEHLWGEWVVAYDQTSRENLIQALDHQMASAAVSGSTWLDSFTRWVTQARFWIASQVLGGLMLLMLVGVVVAVLWFLYERWRLRRRVMRIGIDSLPPSDRMRLARQLGFYDDLMRLLGRHQIERPPHLTPLEFARSLVFLPPEAYGIVSRLTHLSYRIRYGQAELKRSQRRRLATVLGRLESAMEDGRWAMGSVRRET